jgi:hypothetical protein
MPMIRGRRAAFRSLLIAAGLILLNLFAACTPKSDAPIVNIEKDTIREDGETIGLLELKMVDKTYSLDSYMPLLVVDQRYPLYFLDSNMQPMEWMMWHYWKTQGQANSFEAVCLLRIKPGTYGVSNLVLEKQQTSSFDQSHRVNILVDKHWQVPANRLAYLGELRIEFTKRRITADGKGTYRHTVAITHEATDFLHLLQRFKYAYPRIYNHYENKCQVLTPGPGRKPPKP